MVEVNLGKVVAIAFAASMMTIQCRPRRSEPDALTILLSGFTLTNCRGHWIKYYPHTNELYRRWHLASNVPISATSRCVTIMSSAHGAAHMQAKRDARQPPITRDRLCSPIRAQFFVYI